MLPLWKLNPAKDGTIIPTADFPRKYYNDFRNLKEKPRFIKALFGIPADLATELSELTGYAPEMFSEVEFTRYLDGRRTVDFVGVKPERTLPPAEAASALESAKNDLTILTPLKSESETHPAMLAAIAQAIEIALTVDTVDEGVIDKLRAVLTSPNGTAAAKSSIAPRFARLHEELDGWRKKSQRRMPTKTKQHGS